MHCSGFSSSDVKRSHFTCSWQLIRKRCCVNRSFCKALEWSWNSACLAESVTMSLPISIQISYFWLWLGYREIQRRKAERNGMVLLLFFSFLFEEEFLQTPFMAPDLHICMSCICPVSRLENSKAAWPFLSLQGSGILSCLCLSFVVAIFGSSSAVGLPTGSHSQG